MMFPVLPSTANHHLIGSCPLVPGIANHLQINKNDPVETGVWDH